MTEDEIRGTGMYRNVWEQPACWDRLLSRDLGFWKRGVQSVRAGLLVGMGASYYAGLAAEAALMGGRASWHALTSDRALYYLPRALRPMSALVVSQSGESADTLAAARELGRRSATVLAVTNNAQSPLAGLARVHLDLECGEEKGSATKTYTTSVLALLMGALDWAGVQYAYLPERAQAILERVEREDASRGLFGEEGAHYFLGAGPNRATALQAALLCKEKLRLHAEGIEAAEFMHGPIETLDERDTVWLFTTEKRLEELYVPLARRVSRTGARLVIVGEGAGEIRAHDISPKWWFNIDLEGPEELGTLLFILPAQMLVVQEAARRGFPVDTFQRMEKVMRGYEYGAMGDG